jgi:DnaJ-class molecular chaperone
MVEGSGEHSGGGASLKDYYQVLGVPPTASQEELKRSFRQAARSSHPDFGGTTEQFQEVQEAWAVLGDEARRAQYDAKRVAWSTISWLESSHETKP